MTSSRAPNFLCRLARCLKYRRSIVRFICLEVAVGHKKFPGTSVNGNPLLITCRRLLQSLQTM